MKSLLRPAVIALLPVLAGCATLPDRGRKDLLQFLDVGRTTREEVLLRLGQPSGVFEAGRIFTYRIAHEQRTDGFYVVEREVGPAGWTTWALARHSLVLVFAEDGRLERQSLVDVNGP